MRRILMGTVLAAALAGLLVAGVRAESPIPQSPTWVAAIYVEAQRYVGLRWTPVKDGTGYRVLRSETEGKGHVFLADVPNQQHFDATVEPGKVYFYRLQTLVGDAVGPLSAERRIEAGSAEDAADLLTPPEWLPKLTMVGRRLTLAWKPLPGAIAYNVYFVDRPGWKPTMVGSTRETKFEHHYQFKAGETYTYSLTALDRKFRETAHAERKIEMRRDNPDLAYRSVTEFGKHEDVFHQEKASRMYGAPSTGDGDVRSEERAMQMNVAPSSGVRGTEREERRAAGAAAPSHVGPSPPQEFYRAPAKPIISAPSPAQSAPRTKMPAGRTQLPGPSYEGFGESFDEVWVISRPEEGLPPAPDDDTPGCGELRALLPGGKQIVVPLEHTDVRARVAGYVASVIVTQKYRNPYSEKIEAVYVFPLPANSAVSDFVMTIGERRIRGVVRERREAERIYRDARNQGYAASLLTQERPNVFTQKVANIEPGKAIDVDITYFNTLAYEDGAYSFVFPMVVGPRYNPAGSRRGIGAVSRSASGASGQATEVQYLRPDERSGHDIMVDLEIDAGVRIEGIESPSHAVAIERRGGTQARVRLKPADTVPNKDFVLRYRVAGGEVKTALMVERTDRGGYFTLMLQPPANLTDVPRCGQELVFVIDVSGSMSGLPIERAKAATARTLQSLRPEDTFQLVHFASGTGQFSPQPLPATPENVRRGLAYLERLRGAGGTEMLRGIQAALDFPHDPRRLRVVSFMTDGFVGNEQQILAAVAEKLGPARIFSMGVGSSVNRYLLEGLARLGKGAVAYLLRGDSDAVVVDRFFERVQHAALTDIEIDWGGMRVTDVYPRRIPDLFVGRPVVLTGRFEGHGDAEIRIRGRVAGEPQTIALRAPLDDPDSRHAGISRIWARARIADLSDEQVQARREHWQRDLSGEIRETALAYGLVSEYTAFLAVDSTRVTEGDYGVTVPVPVPVPEGVRYDTTVQGGR